MNSSFMNKVFEAGLSRDEFVAMEREFQVPTHEMYEITEEAYHLTQKLFDIDGGSERFEKNATRFLKNKNLSHKLCPIRRIGFGFSYDKLYKYFEILDQQHKEELSQLESELQQLQGEKKVFQVPPQKQPYSKTVCTSPSLPRALYAPPPQTVYTQPPPRALYAPPPPPQTVYTPPAPRPLYAPPPPPPQTVYTPSAPKQSQDVRFGNTSLKSLFVANEVLNRQTPSSVVYPNGHHFPCQEPLWC